MAITNILPNDLSALPTLGSADRLHQSYKNKLIYSLNKLTSYVVEELNLNGSSILQHLKVLANEPSRFLTPWSYYIYFKLRTAIMNDEAE